MMTYIGGNVDNCSFAVTEKNQEAMNAVLDFSEEEEKQLLCIYGEEGTGKTHLSRVARDVLDENGFMVRILTEWNWMEAVTRWKDQGRCLGDLYQDYEKWDGLILENIHQYQKDEFREAFCSLLNQFWIRGKKILVTCDRHPQDLEWFEEEKMFEKVCLSKPSLELKKLVLQDYEQIGQVVFPEKIRNVILERSSKLPAMRHALNRAIFQHKTQGKALTVELFESILKKEDQNL